MQRNLLVLIPSKEIEKSANKAATLRFRESGDESVYALPHVIVLGYTDKKRFDRRNFSILMQFEEEMIETEFGFVLPPTNMDDIYKLQKEYGLDVCDSGLWFSNNDGWSLKMEPSTKQRLAMLSWNGEGYTLLQ